jgi:hypothetical protein
LPSKRIKVVYTDGKSKEVRIGPKAEVMFERHFKVSMTKAGNDISAENMYYLAWASLHCAGVEPLDFDSFLDVLEDVEKVDGADAVDPSQSAQSPEP